MANKEKNPIINFSYLIISQIGNYILPLIIIPFIANNYGPNNFGEINIAQNIVFYFNLLISFGFDLSATKKIAINSSDKKIQQKIFVETITAKIYLFTISLISLSLLSFFSNTIKDNLILTLILLIGSVGSAVYPTWLFQGNEDLKYISWFNVSSKFLTNIIVLLIINKTSDPLEYVLIISICQLFIGVYAFFVAISKYKLRIIFSNFNDTYATLKDSFSYFISNLSISAFASSGIIVLGAYSNPISVGIYAVSVKLVAAYESVVVYSFNQAFFPYIAKKLKDKENTIKIIKPMILGGFIFFIISGFTLFFCSQLIINTLFGVSYIESIHVLKILSFVPGIIIMRTILLNQLIINLGTKKLYSNLNILYGIVGLSLTIILTKHFDFIGTAYSRLFSELFVLLISLFFSYKIIYDKTLISRNILFE